MTICFCLCVHLAPYLIFKIKIKIYQNVNICLYVYIYPSMVHIIMTFGEKKDVWSVFLS